MKSDRNENDLFKQLIEIILEVISEDELEHIIAEAPLKLQKLFRNSTEDYIEEIKEAFLDYLVEKLDPGKTERIMERVSGEILQALHFEERIDREKISHVGYG